jgi:hypothetical protein
MHELPIRGRIRDIGSSCFWREPQFRTVRELPFGTSDPALFPARAARVPVAPRQERIDCGQLPRSRLAGSEHRGELLPEKRPFRGRHQQSDRPLDC